MPHSHRPSPILRVLKRTTTIVLIAMLSMSCSRNLSTNSSNVELVDLPAPSLTENLLQERTIQPALVYLPPSYRNSPNRRYPVVYFLQGFYEELSAYQDGTYFRLLEDADAFFDRHPNRHAILVVVNGKNKLGGSFYRNSPVTGRWEDFVVHDVVSWIDANYRTIPERDGRGLAGYSMGGYGAFHIALDHPETYASLFCLSPAWVDDRGIEQAIRTWIDYRIPAVQDAYAAVFAPAPEGPFPYGRKPDLSNLGEDPATLALWNDGLGNLETKIERGKRALAHWRAIRIEAGRQDEFPWIPKAVEYVSKRLERAGIRHEVELFEGTHENRTRERLRTSMLEFFARTLF